MAITLDGTAGVTTPGVANTANETITGNLTVSGSATFATATITSPTFTNTPLVTTAQSMVWLTGQNGYGSTNTLIRRFVTVQTNQGSSITYADSATLGASFTINTNGVYGISHYDVGTTYCGISLNTTQPTTGVLSINANTFLAASPLSSVGTAACCLYLPAGSVIRAHHNTTNSGGTNTNFIITRIA